MTISKARVKINGQEYTISGERDSEEIVRIARYVDEKIKYITTNLPQGTASSLAVLAAVNIADELFITTEKYQEVLESAEQNEKNAEEYAKLWEESKTEIEDLKQEIANLKEEMQKTDTSSSKQARENEIQFRELNENLIDLKMENTALKNEVERIRAEREQRETDE